MSVSTVYGHRPKQQNQNSARIESPRRLFSNYREHHHRHRKFLPKSNGLEPPIELVRSIQSSSLDCALASDKPKRNQTGITGAYLARSRSPWPRRRGRRASPPTRRRRPPEPAPPPPTEPRTQRRRGNPSRAVSRRAAAPPRHLGFAREHGLVRQR